MWDLNPRPQHVLSNEQFATPWRKDGIAETCIIAINAPRVIELEYFLNYKFL